MTYKDIINSIETHLSKSTKKFYKDFYIGITDNVDQRLFGYHHVSRTDGWWIYCTADSEEIARQVEAYYIDKGMDGGPGGGKGEGNTRIVYCYEKTYLTKERDE